MTLDEINEAVEHCNKKLDDYNIQIEALSNKDDLMSEDAQAQFDYLIREIEKTTGELEDLIKQIQ
jgi:peptidoglycan hydrolase CwlO-like protein